MSEISISVGTTTATGIEWNNNDPSQNYIITNAREYVNFMLGEPAPLTPEDLMCSLVKRMVSGIGNEHDVEAMRLITERNEREKTNENTDA